MKGLRWGLPQDMEDELSLPAAQGFAEVAVDFKAAQTNITAFGILPNHPHQMYPRSRLTIHLIRSMRTIQCLELVQWLSRPSHGRAGAEPESCGCLAILDVLLILTLSQRVYRPPIG